MLQAGVVGVGKGVDAMDSGCKCGSNRVDAESFELTESNDELAEFVLLELGVLRGVVR